MVEGISDRGPKFSTLAAGQSSQSPNRTRYPNAKVGEAAVVNFGPRVARSQLVSWPHDSGGY